MAHRIAKLLVFLALPAIAHAQVKVKSWRFLDVPPGERRENPDKLPALPSLEVVVAHAALGMRTGDFGVHLEEENQVPITIGASKSVPFAASDEDLSVVILVQGNVLFMGDPESQPEPTPGYYEGAKEAVDVIAKARPRHTRMGLYVYGKQVTEKVPMGPAENVSGEALGRQKDYVEVTDKAFRRGLEQAVAILSHEQARRVLFIIGDGSDQVGDYSPRAEVQKLEDASIEVFVLGASPRQPLAADQRRLDALGKLGAYRYANQKEQAADVTAFLANEMNDLYTVVFPGIQASDRQMLPEDGLEHTFKVKAGNQESAEATGKFAGPFRCIPGAGIRCICPETPPKLGPPCTPPPPPPPWLWILLGSLAAVAAGAVVYWKTRPERSTALDEPEPEPEPEAPAPVPPSPQHVRRDTYIHDPNGSDDAWPAVGWIVPVNGPAAFQTFRLDRRTLIGAGGDCQVRIEDPFISGHHAEILLVAGAYVLVDAGAANGVVFSNKRVDRHPLIDNDTFTCGRTDFKFKTILD